MYDRPLIEDLLESGVGEDSEKYWRRQSIFPVERRWALVWEEVQENEETARRIRANPQDWVPVSFDQDVEELTPRFLDLMREEAARGLPH